jgi:hypothetical protein
MVVQQIYRGWALLGVVVSPRDLHGAHTLLVRSKPTALRLSLTAFLCLAAAQAIFLDLHLPDERRESRLEQDPRSLRGRAAAVGVFPCGRRRAELVALLALIGSLLRADPSAQARRP